MLIVLVVQGLVSTAVSVVPAAATSMWDVASGVVASATVTTARATSPSAPAAIDSPDWPRSVRVKRGDTLWSIARRLQPQGEVRPLVDRLAAANGGATLQVGQVLMVE
ncbi:MAG TPA: LysM domain-containing protein [Acidimicrobiales bacterium]